MELSEIKELLSDFDKLQKKVIESKGDTNVEAYLKQYEPKDHDVFDEVKRPKKDVKTDKGTKKVEVARFPVPLQKRIVARAAQTLCGNPIQLVCNPANDPEKNLLEIISKIWDDNKLDYESKALAKVMMSETEVAELWYVEEADPEYWDNTPNKGIKADFDGKNVAPRLRMLILSNSNGNDLYPVFNTAGDMVAFGRGYKVKVEGKDEEHFDLYTAEQIILSKKVGGEWVPEPQTNFFGKIPVIYYSQPEPEWADVQWLIDGYEKLLSNLSDTNAYFGAPMVKVKGKVNGFAEKGEQGKVIQLDGDKADANYMTWDQSPESIKLELNTLRSLIFDMTDTVDFSFDMVKGLGEYSGIALKMLFLPAHMKSADKEETFGKSIQRRINFLKAAAAKINRNMAGGLSLSIKPKFEYFIPKNDTEKIEMLMTATGNKPILSKKTAVSQNPLVSDPEAELKQIEAEQNSAQAGDEEINNDL